MKRITFLCLTALVSLGMFATPKYLVETGEDGDATWSVSIAGATVVNLKTEDKTLGEWMNATFASNGYETWIAAGTYVTSGITVTFSSIKLYGGFAGTETATSQRVLGSSGNPWDMANPTIIDANSSRLFGSSSNPQHTWDGLTFTNSVAGSTNGGVARIVANAVIRNCRFINNSSTNQGGALQTFNATNIQISDCYFEGNSGGQGGAIYVNNAKDNTYAINHCYFKDNDATNAGGAVYFQNDGTYTVNACVFDHNNASNNAPALFSNGTGTGAYTKITNCLFKNQQNSSKIPLYLLQGAVLNCTFASNAGGSIYIGNSGSEARCENNVVWGANDTECNISIGSVEGYTMKNNALGKMITPSNVTTDGNVTITKGDKSYFKSADTGDFHLTSGATEKMVGKGRDVSADGVTKDLDGLTRFVYDIGCYMYPSPAGCDNCFFVQP